MKQLPPVQLLNKEQRAWGDGTTQQNTHCSVNVLLDEDVEHWQGHIGQDLPDLPRQQHPQESILSVQVHPAPAHRNIGGIVANLLQSHSCHRDGQGDTPAEGGTQRTRLSQEHPQLSPPHLRKWVAGPGILPQTGFQCLSQAIGTAAAGEGKWQTGIGQCVNEDCKSTSWGPSVGMWSPSPEGQRCRDVLHSHLACTAQPGCSQGSRTQPTSCPSPTPSWTQGG